MFVLCLSLNIHLWAVCVAAPHANILLSFDSYKYVRVRQDSSDYRQSWARFPKVRDATYNMETGEGGGNVGISEFGIVWPTLRGSPKFFMSLNCATDSHELSSSRRHIIKLSFQRACSENAINTVICSRIGRWFWLWTVAKNRNPFSLPLFLVRRALANSYLYIRFSYWLHEWNIKSIWIMHTQYMHKFIHNSSILIRYEKYFYTNTKKHNTTCYSICTRTRYDWMLWPDFIIFIFFLHPLQRDSFALFFLSSKLLLCMNIHSTIAAHALI